MGIPRLSHLFPGARGGSLASLSLTLTIVNGSEKNVKKKREQKEGKNLSKTT